MSLDDRFPVNARVWAVGALCRAIADALQARFNPVEVEGEISGFSRAASGHCYFSLKDEGGQLRCAMFRRSASLLDFTPRDGEHVHVRGRLAVYEPRGDLQLVVESMSRAGQGALFEKFLRIKAQLEAEGLFDAARKRPLPLAPRCIGLVTSLGAAALHDVATALRRRIPHVRVLLSPAPVQGAAAPIALVDALRSLYAQAIDGGVDGRPEVILLVRGGGSIEDLWAFNDETLARAIAESPVPVITGIGHETDFTIADFCADLRAPTPTAAAELVSESTEAWRALVHRMEERLVDAVERRVEAQGQRLDLAARRMGRPSGRIGQEKLSLQALGQSLKHAAALRLGNNRNLLQRRGEAFPDALHDGMAEVRSRLERQRMKLDLLDPSLVLARGYAWITNQKGAALSSVTQFEPGQSVTATLADGSVGMTVTTQP